jgi:hypothetical protein
MAEGKLVGLPTTVSAGSMTARTRTNLSVLHLLSAAYFSRKIGELEALHDGEAFGGFWEEILAVATGTIFAATSGLEAYANELFVDHAENFPVLPQPVMVKLWELYEQKSTLEKFEFALLPKNGEPFDRGVAPYQNIGALIKLRNGLTHFKPEWSDEAADHAKISSVLSARIKLSKFFPASEPLFPRGWASHSCTKWALESVVHFIEDFENRSDLPKRMAPFQERLRAL